MAVTVSGFYDSYLTLFPHLCSLLPLVHYLWAGSSNYRIILLSFVVLLATAVCFPSFNHVANFSIVPDSVEYASSARNFLSQGSPFILVEEKVLPSRYPFGFSLFLVSPGILLGNFASGSEILFITVYSVVGVVCCYILGEKLAGPHAGVVSVILLLLLPPYVLSSQELLTYSPSAGLALLFLLFCYRLYEQPRSRSTTIGIAASLLLSVACRPLSVFLVIPVVIWSTKYNRGKLPSLFLCFMPTAILLASYLIFNDTFFSSPFRSGYNFWSSIPYDFPELVLNFSYLGENIGSCIRSLGLIMLLGACSVRWYSGTPLNHLLMFSLIFFGLPLTVFHLLYFYPGSFFYLQSGVLAVPVVAAMLAKMIHPSLSSKAFPSALILLFLVGCLQRFTVYQRVTMPRSRALLVEEATSVIPSNSILISGIDPVSFSLLAHGKSTITVVPKSRSVEYASKVITPVKPRGISVIGISPFNHRNKILLSNGAEDAVSFTALDDLTRLKGALDKGVSVYLETVTKDELTVESLKAHFTVTKVTDHLYRILPLSAK